MSSNLDPGFERDTHVSYANSMAIARWVWAFTGNETDFIGVSVDVPKDVCTNGSCSNNDLVSSIVQ